MNKNMTIIAQALADNREYKSARINAKLIGDVAEARKWQNAVNAMRLPAYEIWAARHDSMGNAKPADPVDQSKLYDALRVLLDMVGEVKGYKLFPENCAEVIISEAHAWKNIDLTPEMAHAHNERTKARKAQRDAITNEEIEAADKLFEQWDDECKRLEALPGQCKSIPTAQKPDAFVRTVEKSLGDAITGQIATPVADIVAAEEARKADRKARAKARKQANKAVKADATKTVA